MFQQRLYFFILLFSVGGTSLLGQCPPQSLPFFEDFNAGSGCFNIIDGGSSSDTWVNAPLGGTTNTPDDIDSTAYMLADSDAAGSGGVVMRETLESPYIDASGTTGSLLLSFDHYFNAIGGDSIRVDVRDSAQGWLNLYIATADVGSWISPATTTLDLSPYAHDSLQVRFVYSDGGAWAWFWAIDNVSINEIPCLAPFNVSIDSVQANQFNLNFGGQADSLQFEWGPVGFTQGTGCLGTAATNGQNTITLSNSSVSSCNYPLSANQCYWIYVRSNCTAAGNGLSSWSGPFQFCTPCNLVNLPFTENFNNGSLGCFSALDGGNSPDTWFYGPAGGTANLNGDLDGTGFAGVDSDGAGSGGIVLDENLLSPVINAGNISGSLVLEFDHFYRNLSQDSAFVDVYNGSQWVNIVAYDATQGAFAAPVAEFFDITAYANANLQVRFRYRDNGSWAWWWLVDNFSVREVACSPSSNLQLGFAGADSLNVNWTAGSATSFVVEYGTSGFSLGTGIRFLVSSASAGIGNLVPQSNYDVYVLDSCGGSLADTLGPLSVATSCLPGTIPYFEDFDAGQACFTVQDGGSSSDTWLPVPAGGTSNVSGDLNGTPFMLVDSDGAGSGPSLRELLVSPPLDASAFAATGSLYLSFLQYYNHLSGDSATVEVYDGSQWVQVAGFNADRGGFAAPDSQVIDVSAYANANFQVRFVYDDAGTWAWHWMIDNFRVEGFLCSSPTGLDTTSVDPNNANLTWNSPSGLSNINWGPTGFRQGSLATGNFVRGVSNIPYNLGGLSPSTCYDVYVQDTCSGVGNGPWLGPITFCTPATCVAPGNLNAGAITSSSANLSWTGSGSSYQISLDTAGQNPGSNPTLVSGTSYAATGLLSAQNYCFYVREICQPGDTSTWTGPYCFNTACNIFNAPYFEDFEGGSASCWSNDSVSGDKLWTISSGSSGGSVTAAYSGFQNAVFTSSFGGPFNTRFVSPIIDASNLSSVELTFYYAQEVWAGDQNTLTVYYRTSPSGSWTQIWQDLNDVSSWTQATVAIPVSSATLQIAFEGEDNWGRANVIDDVRIDIPGGSCTVPSAASTSNADCEGFTINWLSSTGGSIVEYGPSGFNRGSGTFSGVVSPPFQVNGLSPNQSYDYYLADTCGNDTSQFVGPFNASTNNQGLPLASFAFSVNPVNILEYSFDASASSGKISNYRWDFGDGNTGSGVNPVHTYASAGSYNVQLIADGNCGADTVLAILNDVSQAELASARISLYPNPSKALINLTVESVALPRARLILTDAAGKVVGERQADLRPGEVLGWDLGALPKGVYLFRLETEQWQWQERVILH